MSTDTSKASENRRQTGWIVMREVFIHVSIGVGISE